MLKHIFIYLCLATTFLWANERSLHLAHDDVLRSQDRDLLSGKHYILKTFPGNKLISVYLTADKMSIYSTGNVHTSCVVSGKQGAMEIKINHVHTKQSISHSIYIDNSEVKFTGNEQAREVALRYASLFNEVGNPQKFLLKIAMPLSEIARHVFPKKQQRGHTKLKKNWTMTKSEDDNSVYLSSNGLKIVDYGVFITSKAKNVALARVKGTLVNETLLKISTIQITYHGSDYWLKGQATLVCQDK